MTKKALGKGLSALFTPRQDSENEMSNVDEIVELPIDSLVPNPYQPREFIKDEQLEELANSIKECGLLHPVSVRRIANQYEIIEGERRVRACKKLGYTKIPAVIRNVNDKQMLVIALIENLQRENLNPIEEAKGYNRLINEYQLTQQEVADKIGKSRSNVANMLRLLNLPHLVKEALELQKLDVGHARAILSLENPNLQRKVCNLIIEKNLTVRETENLIKKWKEEGEPFETEIKKERVVNPDIKNLENMLSEKLKTRVRIIDKKNRGKIIIDYYSIEDFQKLYDLLGKV